MARAVRAGTRVDAALLVACALLALLAIVLPTPTRDAIAGALQRSLAAPLLAMQQRSERARTAFAERELVAARVDSLSLRVRELSQLDRENARLRKLLGLGRRIGRDFVPAEAVHAQSIGDTHAILLTVGSRAGVAPRSAVVAPEGVVGLVTSVAANTSQAILWSHPDFRVSAMSIDEGTFGIVTPHLSGDTGCEGCEGPARQLLELRGVPFRDTLSAGTMVVSSGLGGVFPRGIVVGTVMGELKSTEQWSRTYLLRPAVRPSDVSSVLVLSPSMAAENLSGRWELPAGALVQQVVAAGDSMQRAIAADSARARQMADSIAASRLAPPDTGAAVTPAPAGAAAPPVAPRRAAPAAPGTARRDSVRRP